MWLVVVDVVVVVATTAAAAAVVVECCDSIGPRSVGGGGGGCNPVEVDVSMTFNVKSTDPLRFLTFVFVALNEV